MAASSSKRSFLPPFANEENKALDAQIRVQQQLFACLSMRSSTFDVCQVLEAQLESAEGSLEENSDRISIMDEHLKNVQQELKYTQSRVTHREGSGKGKRAH
jgi:coiled-coil domain-containing protein 39